MPESGVDIRAIVEVASIVIATIAFCWWLWDEHNAQKPMRDFHQWMMDNVKVMDMEKRLGFE